MPQNHSEELTDLLGKPPVWITRWGISVILGALVTVVAASWWVEYPDKVKGNVQITTEQTPVRLMARVGGKVERLLVKEGQKVHKNEAVCRLESTANSEDVLAVERSLAGLQITTDFKAEGILLSNSRNLGDLQAFYSTFAQSLDNFCMVMRCRLCSCKGKAHQRLTYGVARIERRKSGSWSARQCEINEFSVSRIRHGFGNRFYDWFGNEQRELCGEFAISARFKNK